MPRAEGCAPDDKAPGISGGAHDCSEVVSATKKFFENFRATKKFSVTFRGTKKFFS